MTRSLCAVVVSLSVACGGGSDGGGGSGGCTNACDTSGGTRCSGPQVQTCQAGASGCLAWSAAANCPNAQTCNAATNACAAACTDACTQGARQCSGTQVQTCQKAASGCLAWSTPASCPGTQVCSANGCVADACNGVPANGVCATATSVSFCGTPTGESVPRVLTYSCAGGESCQMNGGKASCVLTSACVTGSIECANATTLRACVNGSWTSQGCAGSCRDSALGAFCAAPGALKPFSGTVVFEAKVPNDGLTDWTDAPNTYYAPRFLVLSQAANGMYDSVYTGAQSGSYGQFTIQVPQTPGPDDRIVVAAAADDGKGGLSFVVASPGFDAAGEHQIGEVGKPALWSWAWKTSALTAGEELRITEAMGSGVANVYFNLIFAYQKAHEQYGHYGLPAIVWIGSGATWSCGACFAPFPTNVFDIPFQAQVWFGDDPEDQAYWSDAVTSHELGHLTMASFGRSPGEGGPHYIGKPTFPGQAWSEGWATWFSSDVRGDPIYYDKQSGTFFWVNIDSESYSSGSSFVAPRAADGLLQLLDENEVSATLWRLSSSAGGAENSMFAALASPRLTTSTASRGYTRHQWSYDETGEFTDVVDSGEASLCLADFLDGLDCGGFSRSAIDAATVPATRYPYPSANPICQ